MLPWSTGLESTRTQRTYVASVPQGSYAAGYTLLTLRKKIEKGSHALKEEMVLTTMELVAGDEDGDEERKTSAEWVNLVDRDGLWHITNATFMFFCAIEEVLRSHLKVSAIK